MSEGRVIEPGAMEVYRCVDCGAPYRAPLRAFNRQPSGRCPDCRKERKRAYELDYTRAWAAERRERQKGDGAA